MPCHEIGYHYEEGIARARMGSRIKTIPAMAALLEDYEREKYYKRSRKYNNQYLARNFNNMNNYNNNNNNYRSNQLNNNNNYQRSNNQNPNYNNYRSNYNNINYYYHQENNNQNQTYR